MTTTNLPVLFLTDLVVLPGMVVPIELDDAARAAVDAARSHSDGKLLVAPRLDDRYASFGVSLSGPPEAPSGMVAPLFEAPQGSAFEEVPGERLAWLTGFTGSAGRKRPLFSAR